MALISCSFFAETLGVSTSLKVLLPQTANGQVGMGGSKARCRYPVLYLLHGWSDDETIWTRRTSIERYAAEYGMVIVMPRVELSYYQNMASGMPFWDFIHQELPARVQAWFPVSDQRADTFAAGLSMGGYGAFRLGLSFPERFAAVASLSGALDIRAVATETADPLRRSRMQAIFGRDFERMDDSVDLFRLAEQVAKTAEQQPRLFQWCGTEDFLFPAHLRFRDHALAQGLNLTHSHSPGDHNWAAWDEQIQRVLQWLVNPAAEG